jgi:phospholipid/cholesterol/gamma-HCH transport system substrate-binding protein
MSRTTLAPLAVVLGLLLFGLTGCGNDDAIELVAVFDDVVDLTNHHHVRAGDVPIGTVTDIQLTDDDRALVQMVVEQETGLPAEVEAVLRKTALLGERYVELRPVGDGGELGSGQIERTRVLSDIEEFVGSGEALLGAVSAGNLANAIQVGAVALEGQSGVIGQLIDRTETFVGRFDANRQEIVRLIEATDTFVTGMAAEAEVNAQAISELARASEALQQEDDRLLDALDDLARLAEVGERVLRDNRTEFDNLLRRLHLVLQQVLRIDGALQGALTWLPAHNFHVPNGMIAEHVQVWNDFTVCGFNDEPDNPSNTCTPPNPGETNSPPPTYIGPDSCDMRHEDCPAYPDGVEPFDPERRRMDG